MITSFDDPVAEKLFRDQTLSRKEVKRLGSLNLGKTADRLKVLNKATEKDLLSLPSLKYHKLHGTDRYSIEADSRRSPWRITFCWDNDELTDVSLVRIEDTH